LNIEEYVGRCCMTACIQDVRYAGTLFPLASSEDSSSALVEVRTHALADNCASTACGNIAPCPDGQYCYDMWRATECRWPLLLLGLHSSATVFYCCTSSFCLSFIPYLIFEIAQMQRCFLHTWVTSDFFRQFLRARASIVEHVLAMVILSVCLSVCLSVRLSRYHDPVPFQDQVR